MTTLTARLFLIISLMLLGHSALTETTVQPPRLIDGTLDLSQWQSRGQQSLNLSGHWFWQPEQKLRQRFAPAPAATLQTVPVKNHGSQASQAAMASYWIDIVPPATVANQQLGLLIKRTCSSARIYLQPSHQTSTNPIANMGKTGAKGLSEPYAGSQIIPLTFQSSAPHRLLVQTSNQDYWSSGLCGEVRLGDISVLHRETTANTIELSMLTAMLAMAALYSIAIYAQRPQDKAPMWLTLACCSTAVFFFMYASLLETMVNSQAPWLFELHYRSQLISASWVPAAMLMFYSRNFPDYLKPEWLKANLQLTLLVSLFFAITPTELIWPVAALAVAYWAIQFMAGLWVLWKAIQDQQPYARPMLLAVLPITIIVPLELLGRPYVGSPPTFSLYALLFFIFVESQIVGRKFSATFRLAERLSCNLREEVALQTAELHDQNQQLEKAQQALRNANTALKELSITDGLTRIYNRMHFEQEFHKEWRRSARQQTPVSVLMLDADHFKKLNDTAGHKVGDLCLQAISEQLSRHFKRAGELVARYGGEEFVALLPETDQRKALAVAEGLRVAIENLLITHKNESYKVTVSIGISTTIPAMRTTPDNLLEAADAALYEAKASGRNRVAIIPLLANQSQEPPQRQLL